MAGLGRGGGCMDGWQATPEGQGLLPPMQGVL
jgi:hypothetical protein